MSQLNEKVVALVNDAVPALVGIVAERRVREARIRFTNVDGPQFHNFWWIMVEQLEAGKLFARTNDIDLMVGIPPSFHMSVPVDEASTLVDSIKAFLTEKLGTARRVEILLQADANAGEQNIPAQVGNSDDGFARISEQVSVDLC